MPYSEVYYKYIIQYESNLIKYKDKPKTLKRLKKEKAFIEKQLPSLSPLNSYLYFADSDDSGYDGLFTIKEITQIPEKSFFNTRYVILSACNTGVTFAPSTLEDNQMIEFFSIKETESQLRKAGWLPNVDQISFVDIFMCRNINNVYGTLWFADDKASAYLLSYFMKILVSQGQEQDAVAAFSKTQRDFIANCKEGENPLGLGYSYPLHPYFWAVGALFGK